MRLVAILFLLSFISCQTDSDVLMSDTPDQPASDSLLSFLALGDSYTIGESVEPDERWPVQLVDFLNESNTNKFDKPDIIARTGWRTDELLAAIEYSDPAGERNLVSLLIGVNNQYQGKSVTIYQEEFRQLLERAIQLASNVPSRVLVISIPDYGYTPFGMDNQEQISRELDEYNNINRSIAASYNVMYINITDISRSTDPELVAGDNLHPSAEQYRRWVERIIADPDFRERYR
jgi:acyl-CoA thioesterase-1